MKSTKTKRTGIKDLPLDCFFHITLWVDSGYTIINLIKSCKVVRNAFAQENCISNTPEFKLASTSSQNLPKRSLPYVKNLQVSNKTVTNRELKPFLKKFKNLKVLNLKGCKQLTDSVLGEEIRESLKRLDISAGGSFGDKSLSKMKNLESLIIDHRGLFTRGKTETLTKTSLKGMGSLKVLVISWVEIEEGGYQHLTKLEELDIFRGHLNAENANHLKALRRLRLYSSHIDKPAKEILFPMLQELAFYASGDSIKENDVLMCVNLEVLKYRKKTVTKVHHVGMMLSTEAGKRLDDMHKKREMEKIKNAEEITDTIFETLTKLKEIVTNDPSIITEKSLPYLRKMKCILCCGKTTNVNLIKKLKCKCEYPGEHMYCMECRFCFCCKKKLCKNSSSECTMCKKETCCGGSCEKCAEMKCKNCSTFKFRMPWCNCEIESVCEDCSKTFLKCAHCSTGLCEGCWKECRHCGLKVCKDNYGPNGECTGMSGCSRRKGGINYPVSAGNLMKEFVGEFIGGEEGCMIM